VFRSPWHPLLHWALPGFAAVTGMLASGLHYFPVTLPFLLVLIGLLGFVFGMTALRVLRYASISMGIGVGNLLAILSLSLLGSFINIPIAYLPERHTAAAAEISYFGVTYLIPVVRDFAATVGGAPGRSPKSRVSVRRSPRSAAPEPLTGSSLSDCSLSSTRG